MFNRIINTFLTLAIVVAVISALPTNVQAGMAVLAILVGGAWLYIRVQRSIIQFLLRLVAGLVIAVIIFAAFALAPYLL